jgi:hypothetical protein
MVVFLALQGLEQPSPERILDGVRILEREDFRTRE